MSDDNMIECLDDLLGFDPEQYKNEDQLAEVYSDDFVQGKNCKPGQVAAFGIYLGSEKDQKFGSLKHKVQGKDKLSTIVE